MSCHPEYVAEDAETYLRMLGERSVLDRNQQSHHQPGGGALDHAARALLTAGAVSPEVADLIVRDYHWAEQLRRPGMGSMARQQSWRRQPVGLQPAGSAQSASSGSVEPLAAPRVVLCDRIIDQPWGRVTVRSVTLGSDTLSVDVVIRWPGRGTRPRHRLGRLGTRRPHSPPAITVTDDRGTSVQAGFGGGGGDDEWTGQFHAHHGAGGTLSVDTAYLDILGERIDLPPAPTAAPAVRLEPVADSRPAATALWREVTAIFAQHGASNAEAAIGALVTCGVLVPDDPVIAQVRMVMTALGHGYPMPYGVQPATTAQRGAAGRPAATRRRPGQDPVESLPEPWASLIARQNRTPPPGPTGTLPVAAATPVFDGVSAAVFLLTSDSDAFGVSVVMVGGQPPMAGWDPEAADVVWWARDDRQGIYLGQWNGYNTDGFRTTGTIGFDAPLDPAATELNLMPTGPTTRAVIPVPLRWPEPAANPESGGCDG